MIIKRNVIMNGLKLPMRDVLIYADEIFDSHGVECMLSAAVTSSPISDRKFNPRSLHIFGYAVRFECLHISKLLTKKIADELKERLGYEYNVRIKKDHHIQVEYDQMLSNKNRG